MSKNEIIMLPREVVEQALEALINEGEFRKLIKPLIEKSIDSIRDALKQTHRKPTQHDIADSALLGNIESPFNACMHQEHCKRWKAQFDQRHQVDPSSDKDLQSKTGNLATGITASVPKGWKLVPVEPTPEMIKNGAVESYGPLLAGVVYQERVRHTWQAMLDTAPQLQGDETPYLYYDPENGDTWTPEAVDDGFRQPDGLIALYTK